LTNKADTLLDDIKQRYSALIDHADVKLNEVTVELSSNKLLEFAMILRDEPAFQFDVLIDVCGVDYLDYGCAEWETESAASSGYSRGVEQEQERERYLAWDKPRFAAVYHLLSTVLNQRIRCRVFLEGEPPVVDSVIEIWQAASWFEREAFDMYGILFNGHPDFRR